jgi:hypothetical protein
MPVSRHTQRREQRAVTHLEKRPAGGSTAQIVQDPITIGLDKTINVDATKLPPPPNVYDADSAWIEHRPGEVSIFFVKRSRDSDTLRTRLEIRYPPENLVGHFWKNSRDFHDGLTAYVERWSLQQQDPRPDASRLKAEKEHSEWANFDIMAHAGTEATIDFYQLPPPGIAQFTRGQGSHGLRFVPIVRIHLTIFELLRLMNSMAEVVEVIQGYLPQPHSKERVEEPA